MTREEIINDWEFIEDAIPFDAIEDNCGRRVDIHKLIYYTIEELKKTEIINNGTMNITL